MEPDSQRLGTPEVRSSSSVRQFYDHYWTEGFAPTGYRLDPVIVALLDRFAGTLIADVGCGDASHAGSWARAHGRDYVGFDVSKAAVDMSTAQGYDAHLIEDATTLPLEDASVDTVLCMEVLEHLLFPSEALREIRRVLRPRGTLIVTVPNIAHWRTRVDIALFGRWHPGGDHLAVAQPWRDPHLRFFTPKTLRAMLEEVRVSVQQVHAMPEHIFGRMPGLRRFAKRPGRVSVALCNANPALFGTHIFAVCFA